MLAIDELKPPTNRQIKNLFEFASKSLTVKSKKEVKYLFEIEAHFQDNS